MLTMSVTPGFILTHTGYLSVEQPLPALTVKNGIGNVMKQVNKNLCSLQAAILTFGIGDITNLYGDGNYAEFPWDVRSNYVDTVLSYFGVSPIVRADTNNTYIALDYRICRGGKEFIKFFENNSLGTYLISALNMRNAPANNVVLTSPLFVGKKVEDLTRGQIISQNSGTQFMYCLYLLSPRQLSDFTNGCR